MCHGLTFWLRGFTIGLDLYSGAYIRGRGRLMQRMGLYSKALSLRGLGDFSQGLSTGVWGLNLESLP